MKTILASVAITHYRNGCGKCFYEETCEEKEDRKREARTVSLIIEKPEPERSNLLREHSIQGSRLRTYWILHHFYTYLIMFVYLSTLRPSPFYSHFQPSLLPFLRTSFILYALFCGCETVWLCLRSIYFFCRNSYG